MNTVTTLAATVGSVGGAPWAWAVLLVLVLLAIPLIVALARAASRK